MDSIEARPSKQLLGHGWQIAVRYHELVGSTQDPSEKASLKAVAVDAVLKRARELLGALLPALQTRVGLWEDLPADAEGLEFDPEESLDSLLLQPGRSWLDPEVPWLYRYRQPYEKPLLLVLDTSLSMTGEKLALTAVALAVVLLQVPRRQLGVMTFGSQAKVLLRPGEKGTAAQVLRRFLKAPGQGYTHLEKGLLRALRMQSSYAHRGGSPKVSTVLLTDGKYTAGRDPTYLARHFSHLLVLKMGEEFAAHELCSALAKKASGRVLTIGRMENLPSVMYTVSRELLRGRAREEG